MTITVTLPDGSTHEVQPDALSLPDGAQILEPGQAPEGYVSQDYMQSEMQRRLAGKVSKDQLAQDAEFRQKVLQDAGIEIGEDGKPKLPKQIDLDAHRATWEKDKLQPALETTERLVQSLKRNAIRAEAGQHVRDEFLKPVGKAGSFAEQALLDYADVDLETGHVYATDGQGNRVPSSKEGQPYALFGEHVPNLLKQDSFAALRKPEADPQNGSGYKPGGGGQQQISRADLAKMDDATYAKHREAIMQQASQGGLQ